MTDLTGKTGMDVGDSDDPAAVIESFEAAATITKGDPVYMSADHKVSAATSAQDCIGVAVQDADTGEQCPVLTSGRVKVTAGGAITRGKAVQGSDSSKRVTMLTDQSVNEGGAATYTVYRGHKVAVPRKIFRLTRKDELCGVIVYSYPPPACYGRRQVLPRMTMQEMNKRLSIINRVVIHPKYRTISLGAKIISESLPLVGTQYVEMIAVMAKYNPFAEKAGMKKVDEQQSIESVSEVSKVLSDLGFDLQLLGSEHYVEGKVGNLTLIQLNQLKDAFIKNRHPRFKKEFASSRHQPFGKTSDYAKYIEKADKLKVAKLIKLVGILLQTKVYLFWPI